MLTLILTVLGSSTQVTEKEVLYVPIYANLYTHSHLFVHIGIDQRDACKNVHQNVNGDYLWERRFGVSFTYFIFLHFKYCLVVFWCVFFGNYNHVILIIM